jgi:hypothetical protein
VDGLNPVIDPGLGKLGPTGYPIASLDRKRLKVRVGRPQASTMRDRHRLNTRNGTGECHGSGISGNNR